MNNGKIRIYDLSKELNLDNKDILEICKQLNVSVRSHSSTITQSQAERIKAAAELHTASQVSGKGHGSSSSGSVDTNYSYSESSESSQKKRKQEILAVHKHNRQRSISKAQSGPSNKATPVLTPPPPRPEGKASSPAPSQPVYNKNMTPALSSPPIEQTEQKNLKQESSKEKRAVKTLEGESIVRKPKKKLATALNTDKSKLNEPPDRQTPGSSSPKVNSSIPKPVKKSESSVQLPEKKSTAKSKKETEPKATAPKKGKKQLPDLQDRSLLQRPQRPKSAQEDDLGAIALVQEQDRDENTLSDTEDSALEPPKKPEPKKLKRPTPLRPTKRKKWQEEEDAEEKKAKAAKAAAKNKRRKLVIEEDDDDLDAGLESVSLPVSVSLSVARPPKPKSLTPPTVADKTVFTAKKTRKTPGKSKNRSDNRKRSRERQVPERPKTVVLSKSLTIRELSELLKTPETEIIKLLFFKGIAVNITQTLEIDTARLVAEELTIKVETTEEKSAAAKGTDMLDAKDLEHLQNRPPVVTIMGHVDHGKTTLLDSIRKTKVAQGEAGGITQHIGAYHVDVKHEDKKQQIVFLDTPGHEAFTAMRARGTRVTDIAILVVAADDGVQPQTREAISHAKAAEVPIIVAINKTDKPEAQPDRIKQELMELSLVPEEWGGDTIMVPVSALKGENLDNLLEMILLVSELEELSANPNRPAKGTVIEAHLDRTRGPVASLLVQNGTLRVGDVIVAGSVLGKIRAMIDDRGAKVEAATPSFAVEILGLNEVPAAGDEFDVFANEKEARVLAEERSENNRTNRLKDAMSSHRVSLSTISESAKEGSLKELNLILKADVQGSMEAIIGSLKQLPQNEVQIRLLFAAPGEVTETDVDLAAASGAVIIGFNTTLASGARQAADHERVDIRQYNIIYKLLDDIQGAMEGMLDPEEVEESLGEAEVRAVFTVGRGAVAGCYVLSGKIVRNCLVRVRRKGEVIFEGMLDSLKRIKEDVREVSAGYECGIGSAKFHDWQDGDIIEAYQMVLKRRSLSAN